MIDFSNDIEQCLVVLRNGGLILYPTDTIWGIGCDATNEEAVSKIFHLKNRPDTKALIVLLATSKDILTHVANPDPAVFDYLEKLRIPTTVIYEGALGFAANLVSEDGTIAIRIPDDLFCKTLLKRFKKPIVSTSANISGKPSAPFFADISDNIKSGVDYIVHFRQDDKMPKQPSSIVKWKDGQPIILR